MKKKNRAARITAALMAAVLTLSSGPRPFWAEEEEYQTEMITESERITEETQNAETDVETASETEPREETASETDLWEEPVVETDSEQKEETESETSAAITPEIELEAEETETEAHTEIPTIPEPKMITTLTAKTDTAEAMVTFQEDAVFADGITLHLESMNELPPETETAIKAAWKVYLSSRYRNSHPGAWTEAEVSALDDVILESVKEILPYYIYLTDASGQVINVDGLELKLCIRDEMAATQGYTGVFAMHDQAENYAVKPRGGAVYNAGNNSPEFQMDEFVSGWYSFALQDESWVYSEENMSEPAKMSGTVKLAAAGASGDDEEAVPDKFKLTVSNYPDYANAPSNMQTYEEYNWAQTSKKTVIFYESDGTKTTRQAYCLQPSVIGPANGHIYDVEEDAEILEDSTAKERNLTKALYYLYGGPAWGKTVDYADGSGSVNLKTFLTGMGCSTNDNYYCLTHYILAYFYLGSSGKWNYMFTDTEQPGVLNDAGVEAVRAASVEIKKLPLPTTELNKSSVKTTYNTSAGVNVSETITYKAISENIAKITLPSGITLVNETKGTRSTGTASIEGGDKFHLEASDVTGTGSYILKTTFATNFVPMKLKLSGKQDVGFAYYSGDKELYLEVEWPTTTKVKVKKISANTDITGGNKNYSLSGAEFSIVNASGKTVGTLKTGSNGVSDTVEIEPGSYTLKETKAPAGFKPAADKPFTVKAGQDIVEVAVTDEPITGTFQVLLKKVTADGYTTDISRGGAQFKVEFFDGKDASGTLLRSWVFETRSDGMLMYEDNYRVGGDKIYGNNMLPLGSVKITEVKAPTGFNIDSTPQIINVTQSGNNAVFSHTAGSSLVIVNEKLKFGGIKVKKEDKETKTAQGNATLKGTVFSIISENDYAVNLANDKDTEYKKGTVVYQIITDEQGFAQTPTVMVNGLEKQLLQAGTYTIKETKAPEGYKLDNYSYTFTITKDGEVVDATDKPAENPVIRFDITIRKFRDRLSTEEVDSEREPMEGIVFDIYLKSELEKNPDVEPVLSIETDADGVATTVDRENYPNGRLPYGVYTVREAVYPPSVLPVEDFDVDGTEDGQVYDGKEYNEIYIYNKPIEEYLAIAKVDAETGESIPVRTTFQILDENKNAVAEELNNLTTGEDGKVILPRALPYGTYYVREVDAPNGYLRGEDLMFSVTTPNTKEDVTVITYADLPVKGKIQVIKEDAVAKERIAGAIFEIFAAEDIVTGDGTTRLKKGKSAGTVEIGEDGTGESDELYLGTYLLQETKAPEGYSLDTNSHEVKLVYADQDTMVVSSKCEVENKPTTLELYKIGEYGEALAGVSFEILRTGDLETSGIVNPTSESTGTYMTDENGRISVRYLRSGLYKITETETLPGYILDTNARYFAVDTEGFIYETDQEGNNLDKAGEKSDTVKITWINNCTKVDFSKIEVNGDAELPGAEMTVLAEDGTEIESWISGKEPHRINALSPGKYTLLEKTAPEGYVIATEMPFEVEEKDVIQRVTMKDKQVIVSKQDITSGKEIGGAKLKVIDEHGQVVDEWTSEEGKSHPVSGLKVNSTYTLHEETAPDGYSVAEDVTFFVSDDYSVQTVVMKDAPIPAAVKVPKTGLTSLAGWYAMISLLSLAAAILSLFIGRRRNKQKVRKN